MVSEVFSNRTPWSTQAPNDASAVEVDPVSAATSLKMFRKEPGSGFVWLGTAKARPIAWLGVGYGS